MDQIKDQEARDGLRDVRHGLNSHIQTTEIQLKNLGKELEASQKSMSEKMDSQHAAVTEQVSQIRSAILWAGGLIISVMLSVLGWSVLQQISANDAQKQELQNQVRILQESEKARLLAQANAELSASAAETAGASTSNGKPVNLGNVSAPDGR